ncbi:nucleotide disphospho-sugar-binding domain-containing protein [Micromonospora sp. NPDC051925]|uniref:nucleotide disphospho-sugar-binding domain-containing protein n=1 Tax=Micromonospora sp. NPDC051925 TaxID=3364288 RepID=UPI0037C5A3CE
MRVLILAGIAPSTIFSHVPLGTALRNAGHQVMMTASLDDLVPTIAGVGLSAVRVTDPGVSPREIIARDSRLLHVPEDPIAREQQSGHWYARLEAVTLDALLAFTGDWRPDVVIGGMASYAAPLLAKRLGVPYVRHGWDIHDPQLLDLGAAEELQPELAELGLDGLPEPDMMIDITPPSLRPPHAAPAQMMRWIPGNTQRCLEPWMYTRSAETRIGVTIGTGVATYHQYDFLQAIVENVSTLDAEVVVPVAEDALPVLQERLKNVRAGWVPLDVLAPTCDVLVHQSGGSTMMTALSFGVPQVLIPDPNLYRANEMARRIVEAGAGLVLLPEEATSDTIAKTCQEIVSNPAYAAAAGALAREIAALPLPSEVVRRVEWLVHEAPGGRSD